MVLLHLLCRLHCYVSFTLVCEFFFSSFLTLRPSYLGGTWSVVSKIICYQNHSGEIPLHAYLHGTEGCHGHFHFPSEEEFRKTGSGEIQDEGH